MSISKLLQCQEIYVLVNQSILLKTHQHIALKEEDGPVTKFILKNQKNQDKVLYPDQITISLATDNQGTRAYIPFVIYILIKISSLYSGP